MSKQSLASLLNNALKNIQQQQYQQALSYCEQVLQQDSNNVDANNLIGIIYSQQKQTALGLPYLQKAVALQADNPQFQRNLGLALKQLSQNTEALVCYEAAHRLKPDDDEVAVYLGKLYVETEQWEKAKQCFTRLLEQDATNVAALCGLGSLYNKQFQWQTAIDCYEQALAIKPEAAHIYYNIANAYHNVNRYQEAINYYQQTLTINPQHSGARLNIALSALSLGHYQTAWKNYTWRWFSPIVRDFPKQFPAPICDHEQTASEKALFPATFNAEQQLSRIKDKTVLLIREQGFGDEIMFAHFIPLLAPITQRLIVECEARLKPIFERSFPGVLFTSDCKPIPLDDIDYYCYLGDLAANFCPDLNQLPDYSYYLSADKSLAQTLRQKYQTNRTNKLVGIRWKKPTGSQISQRLFTIPLEDWQNILHVSGITFINLQYTDQDTEIAHIKETLGIDIIDDKSLEPLKDIEQSFAQISALDLVITSENSTVHCAGALGVPTWTLLPYSADWRWPHGSNDSPWYAKMRLFRQTSPDDWSAVLSDVAQALRHWIETDS